MHTETPLVELATGHFETGSALLEGVFTFVEQGEATEKTHCLLYENCIVVKLRVLQLPSRRPARNRPCASGSPLMSYSNC